MGLKVLLPLACLLLLASTSNAAQVGADTVVSLHVLELSRLMCSF